LATKEDWDTSCCSAQSGVDCWFQLGGMMTSAMVTFAIAVGGTSLICYALMTRRQNRRANRRSSGDSSGAGSGNYSGETAGAFPIGSVVTMPRWIVQAIRSTRAEAIAGEAAMEVAAATGAGAVINATGLRRLLTCRNSNFLDSF
jgi:hypothetical protein